MKKFFKAILFIFLIYVGTYLSYYLYLYWAEEKLSDKAKQITEGMREEDIINIMGPPKYIAEVSTDKIERGWSYFSEDKYDLIIKNCDALIMYVYYVKTYSVKTFREIPPHKIIRIYLDPGTRKVVYASSIHILADW